MSRRNQEPNKRENLTRREFVRDSVAAAAGIAAGVGTLGASQTRAGEPAKTRSYNPDMKYRRLGKTGLWISAVCMGGHWKRIETMAPRAMQDGNWLGASLSDEDFKKNRYEVVTRCIESGINYIDACTKGEVQAYAEALRGRRDKMFLGCSWYEEEMRNPNFQKTDALLGTIDKGLKEAGLEYADLWRITMHEQSGMHSKGQVEEMMKALEKARQQGKCRFTGFSSHDRPHIKWMIETFPEIVQVVVTPYTAKSKVRPLDSLFDAVRQYDVGVFGIKPFSSNAVFKGDGSLSSPTAEQDDRIARMAIRFIVATDVITAPIPGLINTHQVDNVVQAVKEPDLNEAEAVELRQTMDEAWAKLPADYQWLKNWEYV
ncbi:MAG TPA: aldo/keto reductase [Sedimentisphaerales bacterium]|jgi:aryl-alcohol dehydrogenase-like predicted oxidoreductase|nr:aldo/keto reductase [Sedimentisphaerales bacterium]HNU31258.1 aldo/keto reductase [Sedimentisphaerales bacterium]